jgi:hypothetical protein
MTRIHSTLIALVIGAAATVGLYAAVHTVRLGQKAPAPTVSAHAIALRQAKLAAWRHSLDATLAKRPPKLPKLPHFAPVPPAQAPTVSVATAPSPPVTYVQAPTIVKYKHAPATTTTPTTTTGSDDGSGDDGSGDGGSDDGGSGGGD